MLKLKLKSTGTKANNERSYAKPEPTIVPKEQPEVKEKKIANPAKKVVYIAKSGKCATFDSMNLVALVFGVDSTSVRARLNKPTIRRRKDDWLKGGKIEYIND